MLTLAQETLQQKTQFQTTQSHLSLSPRTKFNHSSGSPRTPSCPKGAQAQGLCPAFIATRSSRAHRSKRISILAMELGEMEASVRHPPLVGVGPDATTPSTEFAAPVEATNVQPYPEVNGEYDGSNHPKPNPEANGNSLSGYASLQSMQGQAPQDNVPVFVMLPLDTVNAEGNFRYAQSKWFSEALQTLKETGIHGVAVDVWWGAVERRPRRYDWAGYRQLFDLVASLGLRLQVVLAFHACGGNIGDNAEVPLPGWVMTAAERDPDILFTDRPRDRAPGRRNRECVSFFAEEEPGLLKGRSALQCYADFMRAFRDEFSADLGDLIEEVVVGSGPCGELRYPSYPETNGWRFPGIGEFQCYDRRALASLARAAATAGRPEWGNAGPHDAGSYNSAPDETHFFQGWGGSWDSEYGNFFLSWYCGELLDHGERMLQVATAVFHVAKKASDSATATPRTSNANRNDNTQQNATAGRLGTAGGSGSSITATDTEGNNNNNNNNNNGGLGLPPFVAAATNVATQISPPSGSRGALPAPPPTRPSSDTAMHARPPSFGLGNASATSLDALGGGGSSDGRPPQAPTSVKRLNTASSPMPSLPLPEDSPEGSSQGAGTGPTTAAGNGGGVGGGQPSVTGPSQRSIPSRQSYASFRSSSYSEGLNTLEDWSWPSPAGSPVILTLKVAGVHWWYRTRSHGAELTAGYYNCDGHDGYSPIVALCARHGVHLTLTCVEMCDTQHPPEALCGPEGLLRQVREAAAAHGVPLGGENALPCFMPNAIDELALMRVVYNTQPWGTPLQQRLVGRATSVDAAAGGAASGERNAGLTTTPMAPLTMAPLMPSNAPGNEDGVDPNGPTAMEWSQPMAMDASATSSLNAAEAMQLQRTGSRGAQLPPMRSFTFLRLTPNMMSASYQAQWRKFTEAMGHNGQEFDCSPGRRKKLGFLL